MTICNDQCLKKEQSYCNDFLQVVKHKWKLLIDHVTLSDLPGVVRDTQACSKCFRIANGQYLKNVWSDCVDSLNEVRHLWKLQIVHVILVGCGGVCPCLPKVQIKRKSWISLKKMEWLCYFLHPVCHPWKIQTDHVILGGYSFVVPDFRGWGCAGSNKMHQGENYRDILKWGRALFLDHSLIIIKWT